MDGREPWVEVLRGVDARQSADCALVLESLSIEYRSEKHGFRNRLSVRAADAEVAAREIESFLRESVARRDSRPLEMFGNAWLGLSIYFFVLLALTAAVQNFWLGVNWLSIGRMDSGRLLAGEWWRAITALSLHADIDHVLANLGFGCFFAYFLSRYVGGGVAWLGIVGAGTLGNFINALLQDPMHRSIGASTAVFGALALLTANTWRRSRSKGLPLRVRAAPVVAGIALLAYTGTGGENTDIGAHLWGFVSGFAIGVGWSFFPAARSRSIQFAAGVSAAALMIAAWAAALGSA